LRNFIKLKKSFVRWILKSKSRFFIFFIFFDLIYEDLPPELFISLVFCIIK